MLAIEGSTFFWSFLAVNLSGFASAWIARLIGGSRRQIAAQLVFFLLLCAVGMLTIYAWQFGLGYWLVSGTTLAIMVLIAVCDFSHCRTEVVNYRAAIYS